EGVEPLCIHLRRHVGRQEGVLAVDGHVPDRILSGKTACAFAVGFDIAMDEMAKQRQVVVDLVVGTEKEAQLLDFSLREPLRIALAVQLEVRTAGLVLLGAWPEGIKISSLHGYGS